MTYGICRGFDFPAREAGDQLRFCNPLISFEEGESAPIYFVRDLDWSLGSDGQARWLTPLDTDEIDAFATLVPGTTLQICPGDGIVLIGEQISVAARSLKMEADSGSLVEFTEYSKLRLRIGGSERRLVPGSRETVDRRGGFNLRRRIGGYDRDGAFEKRRNSALRVAKMWLFASDDPCNSPARRCTRHSSTGQRPSTAD